MIEVRHKAEIDRLRTVVAEITAENLELKKIYDPAPCLQGSSLRNRLFRLPQYIRPVDGAC